VVDVPFQHRQKTFCVCRIARLDHHIQNQPAATGTQIELVPVLDISTALDDDVGV
jgi:hypothetical protein